MLLWLWLVAAAAWGGESNLWPLWVQVADDAHGRPDRIGSLGPLLALTQREDTRILSFRPLWTSFTSADGRLTSHHVLYPLVNWTERGDRQSASSLNLLQYWRRPEAGDAFLQAFPFVFSRRAPDPEDSYFAVWPLGGELKRRFWRDRIQFGLWPLWVRTERGDETRTHFPYPFLQHLDGPRSSGFAVWPLYGRFARAGDYRRTYALWPVYYDYQDKLDQPVPYARFGVLPFYHRETAEGLRSETFLWPFFGYTREGEPRAPYAENRYLWPLLVQGRGTERHVNRWLPVYAHETRPDYAKRWYLWPLLKRETDTPPGLVRERTSLLFFLYRDDSRQFGGTSARLTFLWPFLGYWEDGAGRRQLQALDPLGVFFPANEKVKENWSPLFAVYRLDERGGHRRHALLWDLAVWERDAEGLEAVRLGPFAAWDRAAGWGFLPGAAAATREPARPNPARPPFFRRH